MERDDFIPEESSISPDGLLVRRAYCINMRYFQGKKNYGAYIIPQYDGGVSQSGRRYDNNVWDKIWWTVNTVAWAWAMWVWDKVEY